MKTKTVIWSTQADDKRVLLVMELLADSNTVRTLAFKEESITDDFLDQIKNEITFKDRS